MSVRTSEITDSEIKELIRQYQLSSDSKLKNRIVKFHLYLVEIIARNFSQRYKNQYEDLIQVGCLGLMNAIDKFDTRHNVSFKTYSSHFITGEIKHYLRDHVSLVKLPRELQEMLPRINRAKQYLNHLNNEDPSDSDIASYLEIPLEKIQQALEMEKASNIVSLDQSLNDSPDLHGSDLLSQLEDKKYQSFQLAQEDRIILNDAINSIKEQSRQILEYTFYHDLTQTEIANKMGISQMQVSRKLKNAVKELWEILNTRVTPW